MKTRKKGTGTSSQRLFRVKRGVYHWRVGPEEGASAGMRGFQILRKAPSKRRGASYGIKSQRIMRGSLISLENGTKNNTN